MKSSSLKKKPSYDGFFDLNFQYNAKKVVRTDRLLDEAQLKQRIGLPNVIGVDEVGRGCLAGPVFSCAFVFDPQILLNQNLRDLADSKKLTKSRRDDLFPQLTKHHYCLGSATVAEIDQINILQATFLSMRRAIDGLLQKYPQYQNAILLVDGSFCIPKLNYSHHYAVIDGDQWVGSISAASIVAKVSRDRWMEQLDEKIPGYHFGQHKGYGTKIHKEALAKQGASSEHRRSFKGVLPENIL